MLMAFLYIYMPVNRVFGAKKGLSAASSAATDLYTVICLDRDASAAHIKFYRFLCSLDLGINIRSLLTDIG